MGHHRRISNPHVFEALLRPGQHRLQELIDTWATIGLLLFADPLRVQLLPVHGPRREPPSANPWQATTFEWNTASPPGTATSTRTPVVRRGPYVYSPPGDGPTGCPQHAPAARSPKPERVHPGAQARDRQHEHRSHTRRASSRAESTGCRPGRMGIWWFLASEVAIFGGLIMLLSCCFAGATRLSGGPRPRVTRSTSPAHSTPWCCSPRSLTVVLAHAGGREKGRLAGGRARYLAYTVVLGGLRSSWRVKTSTSTATRSRRGFVPVAEPLLVVLLLR